MKTFKIPCSWENYGCLNIKANNLPEAIEKARNEMETCFLPNGIYVDGSFKIDIDDETFLKILNK